MRESSDLVTRVPWRDWSAAAFDYARSLNRPILLSIVTKWSRGCDEMDAAVFSDEALASLLTERVVPIRVDADRRPDINDRYNLGGWPTTAILAPDGELLGGGTFVPAARLRDALVQAADAIAGPLPPRRSAPEVPAREAAPAQPLDPERVVAFCRSQLVTTFDRHNAGFGSAPKFHHADALEFALELFRRDRDEELLRIALQTLDSMIESELWDSVQGGFYRYAITDDWLPQPEKTLESNVRMARVFLEAWTATGDELHRDRLIALLSYVNQRLTDSVDGGFLACEVDRTLFADVNGLASELFARAAIALSDESLLDTAGRALDRILQPGYEPGGGIAHYVAGGRAVLRPLLCDHVYVSGALLAVFEAAARPVYRDLAAELMHFAVRTMWDEDRGGFRDRGASDDGFDIGLMREAFYPFAANCDAAVVLASLGTQGQAELGRMAQPTLAALSGDWEALGLDACHYAVALLRAAPSSDSAPTR